MIRNKTYFRREELSPYVQDFVTDDMLLFDIETTGLSPKNGTIYCIGCGYAEKGDIVVDLYFAECPEEEKEVLAAFFALLKTHPVTVTFNGSTFDLPFIRSRAAQYDRTDAPSRIEPFSFDTTCPGSVQPEDAESPGARSHLDLYREVLRMKDLLRLPNYKQKTVEQFLGCDREDAMNGGELVAVYRAYVSHPEPESLRLLLLHNRDDVRGMFELLNILAYRQFAQGRFTVTDIMEEEVSRASGAFPKGKPSKNEMPGEVSRFLNIRLKPDCPLPQSIRRIADASGPEPDGSVREFGGGHGRSDEISFLLGRENALIRVPIRHGELKHFFEDYKNYYYLPEEDVAIHRSVGSFVDSAHRVPATRKNCYTRKVCDYVVFPVSGICGELKRAWNDRDACLALPTEEKNLRDALTVYFATFL